MCFFWFSSLFIQRRNVYFLCSHFQFFLYFSRLFCLMNDWMQLELPHFVRTILLLFIFIFLLSFLSLSSLFACIFIKISASFHLAMFGLKTEKRLQSCWSKLMQHSIRTQFPSNKNDFMDQRLWWYGIFLVRHPIIFRCILPYTTQQQEQSPILMNLYFNSCMDIFSK